MNFRKKWLKMCAFFQFFRLKIAVTQAMINIFPKFKKLMDVETLLYRLSPLYLVKVLYKAQNNFLLSIRL
jgi:hypothetical protein